MIYRAVDKQYKVPCAIKELKLPEEDLEDDLKNKNSDELVLEFNLLKELDHPNILRLIEIFRDD